MTCRHERIAHRVRTPDNVALSVTEYTPLQQHDDQVDRASSTNQSASVQPRTPAPYLNFKAGLASSTHHRRTICILAHRELHVCPSSLVGASKAVVAIRHSHISACKARRG